MSQAPPRQRDNDDKIPIDEVVNLNQAGQPRALDLAWTKKDKMRAAAVEDNKLRVKFEDVAWRDWPDGAFASLWVFTRHADGWRGRSAWPMRRADMRFEGEVKVGAGFKKEFSIPVPLDVLGVDPGEEFGLCFGTPTTRSAIVRYTMGEFDQPEEPEEPDQPDDEEPDEPASILSAVERERARYGTPLTNPQMGELLNAATFGQPGWGLARKDIGAHTTQPFTGIPVSRDLLIHGPTGWTYDVLADVEGAGTPAWQRIERGVLPFVPPVDPAGVNPGKGAAWPSPHPAPQLVYGPQVDRIHDKGVPHWASLVERHGFHGILIPCHGLPLDHTGIRALVERVPFALIRLWGDEQRGQTPEGGPAGDVARRYCADLYRLLGHLGPDRWGATIGFDVFEWATREELEAWVAMMQELDMHEGRMLGARARTRADVPPNSRPNPGTYAPWALHVEGKTQLRPLLRQLIADSGSLPVCAEDGFRVRPGAPDRPKDWTGAQTLEGMAVTIDEGVAATWARFPAEGADDDGSIDWPDPAAVRAVLSVEQPDEPDEPDQPDPGPIPPPPPMESAWGLVGDFDQQFKIDALRQYLPRIGWIRTQATPTRAGWNTDVAADAFVGLPMDAGYNVVVGVYDRPEELMPAHQWQAYVLELGRKLIDRGRRVWIIADIETGDPIHMPGGAAQYIDLWAGEVRIVEKLQAMGHKVIGPGMVHGNTGDFDRILGAIRFDAVSAHFYSDRGQTEHTRWMGDAETIARHHGYEWGVSGETGAHGQPLSFADRYCPFDGNAAQIQRVRSLRGDFDARPFWTLKLYYQVLDDPREGGVGYGLFTAAGEAYQPKPVAQLFR